MYTASFIVPALVTLGALGVTLGFLPGLRRERLWTIVAVLLSLAAMLPQASLCLEYGIRLLTHTSLEPPERLSTYRLATLWLLIGPLLFRSSFRRSPRAESSRVVNIVRTGHVVGWTFCAPTTLFTLANV